MEVLRKCFCRSLASLAVLAWANVASAGTVDTFTNAGGAGDQLWQTGSNWANGHAPDASATGIINANGADAVIINSATTANVDNNLFLGLNGWPGAPSGGEVTMTGGSLAVGGNFIIGENNASLFSMSGGTVNAGLTEVGGSPGASGTLTVTGGTFNASNLYVSAGTGTSTVNLLGGTINIGFDGSSGLLFDFFGGTGSTMEVAGSGTLTWAGDWESTLNSYVNTSSFIFTNEAGSVLDVSYDGGADLTTLKLVPIPEPATAMLLSVGGIAGLLLRRRREI